MGFHHVAFATRNPTATHEFYTSVMGFELVKVVTAATPGPTGEPSEGWSKHFFYSTGSSPSGEQGMIAFWQIEDDAIGTEFSVNLNKAAGLPWWVNHIAFDAPTLDDLHRHRDRWRQHGHTVLEIDHEFCISIYIHDPDGNMVEFCHSVRDFTPEEKAHALELLAADTPELEKEFGARIWEPLSPVAGD
jgi:catechol 2,3-dioxygenase-like lactoylglutathione lyase family enzyme